MPAVIEMGERARRLTVAPRSWWVHAAVGVLAVPFVATQNAWFEWSNTLWLLELQTEHVRAHGLPSYFIHGPEQVFYPHHVFYGGPLLAFLAYPSLLLGAWPVLAGVTVAAFSAISAGMTWIARTVGAPAGIALAPGVLLATTPYVVSEVYGRGALTELIALGGALVALGGAAARIAGDGRARAAAAVFVGTAVVAGSHTLTLGIAGLLAVPGLVLVAALLGIPRRTAGHRAVGIAVAALGGVLLCGVFLVPQLWLSGRTVISEPSVNRPILERTADAATPAVLFDPVLSQGASQRGSDVRTQTAVTATAWLLVVGTWAAVTRRLDRRSRRALLALGLVGGLLVLAIGFPRFWLHLPSATWTIQFPFRLVPYLTVVVLLGMAVLLRQPRIATARWVQVALGAAVVWQLATAVVQVLGADARPSPFAQKASAITASSLPNSFAGQRFFQAAQFRMPEDPPVADPTERIDVPAQRRPPPDAIDLHGPQPVGTRLATNVVWSPLIRVTGDARDIGSDADGFVVLQVGPHAGAEWTARVTSRCEWCVSALWGGAPIALLAGRVATAVGVVGLVACGIRRRTRGVHAPGRQHAARGVR